MADFENQDLDQYKETIKKILDDPKPPEIDFFKGVLKKVLIAYSNENEAVRPRDQDDLPGGLLDLRKFNPVVILPDLHARRYFVKDVLFWEMEENKSLLDLLENDQISLLCLGDGVHSEGANAMRWVKAYAEYQKGYKKCPNMNAEIADSFNLMIVIMLLKIRYKERVNFIKGNHENIYNETGNGNYAFAKFANEGAMVFDYFKLFYDEELLTYYYNFEKNLPLFVVGKNFLASHAQPFYEFDRERIINYRTDEELIEGLTWTENFASEPGNIDVLLDRFIPDNTKTTYYFGGHRPINKLYHQINKNRYVQIHNPFKKVAAVIDQTKVIDLKKDIVEVPEYIEYQNLTDDDATILEEDNDFYKKD